MRCFCYTSSVNFVATFPSKQRGRIFISCFSWINKLCKAKALWSHQHCGWFFYNREGGTLRHNHKPQKRQKPRKVLIAWDIRLKNSVFLHICGLLSPIFPLPYASTATIKNRQFLLLICQPSDFLGHLIKNKKQNFTVKFCFLSLFRRNLLILLDS